MIIYLEKFFGKKCLRGENNSQPSCSEFVIQKLEEMCCPWGFYSARLYSNVTVPKAILVLVHIIVTFWDYCYIYFKNQKN